VKRFPLKKKEKPLTKELLIETGLYDYVNSIFEGLIIKKYLKQGTLLVHGKPNTGKSTIMGYIAKIFISAKLG
jgi:hypothetical protein